MYLFLYETESDIFKGIAHNNNNEQRVFFVRDIEFILCYCTFLPLLLITLIHLAMEITLGGRRESLHNVALR
jgi:hypothetical protein